MVAKDFNSPANAARRVENAQSWQCPACTNWNYAGDDVCRWCGEIPGEEGTYTTSETLHPLVMFVLMLGTPLLPGVTPMLAPALPRLITVLNVALFIYVLYQLRYNELVRRDEGWTKFKAIRRQLYVLWCAGNTGFAVFECLQYWLK
jgi:hypothetical protein